MKWIRRKRSSADHIVSVSIVLLPDDEEKVARLGVSIRCNKAFNAIYPPFEDEITMAAENFTEEIAEVIRNVCNRS